MEKEILTGKEEYVRPEIEVIRLNDDSVIVASGNCPIDYHNSNAYFSGMPVAC